MYRSMYYHVISCFCISIKIITCGAIQRYLSGVNNFNVINYKVCEGIIDMIKLCNLLVLPFMFIIFVSVCVVFILFHVLW